MERVPSTPEGKEKLIAELEHSKAVDRPQVIQDIAEARAHGDLRENSEYEDARHRQSLLEGRIAELGSLLARIQVIDPAQQSGESVFFGATVTLETEAEERVYQIVGEHESDTALGKISLLSPLAQALLGKEVGDTVQVGPREFEIVEIVYR